ncbi:MAG: alpha/beta fold hydrolase, partial [Acidobacteriota bacterium]
ILALGLLGFGEAALVIAAAFGVSVRRRQREIGLLGATGASSGGIWQSLLVSAAIVALLGGLAGVLAGAGFAALLHPFLDAWNRRLNGAFELSLEHALAALLLGVLTAVVAATLPARRAARLPIRVALGGRRPAKKDSRRWLRLGLPLVIGGFLLTLLAQLEGDVAATLGVIVGPLAGIVGFGLCSPWLLDTLARRAAPLPLTWRLAIRDAGRFRARNGPVVTAILAGMSMSMTMAVLLASLESAIRLVPTPYRDDQLLIEGAEAEEVADRVAEALTAVAHAPLAIAHVGGEPVRARFAEDSRRFIGETVASGGDDLLVAMGAEAELDAFRAGRLLALDPPPGNPPLELTSWVNERPLTGPTMHPAPVDQKVSGAAFLLHEDFLTRHGLEAKPPIRRTLVPWIVRLPNSVTQADLERARRLAAGSAGTSVDAALLHGRPTTGFYYLVLALCLITGVVIVLIANALSAAESASDERVLHTIGAAPQVVRRHLAARAGYLALLGCVLAVPGGFLPTMGIFRAANLPMELVVPWDAVLWTLLALPVVAYGAAWLLGGRRRLSRVAVWAFAALLLGQSSEAVAAQDPARASVPADLQTVRWTPHVGEAFDGSPLAGELGRITLPENRQVAGGATIDLAFVRYRTSHPNPGPPIVYLAGGPGGSGVEHGAMVATHPQIRLLEHSDVIALDQRGTGLTRPNLVDKAFERQLPLDRAVTRDDLIAALKQAAAELRGYWLARGVDLSAYDSVESADDLEAVRQGLGLDEIVLFGSSYGSHLGLAYLRRHGEHVARAVLLKVEGPDHTWKLPATIQQGLDRLDELARDAPELDQGSTGVLGQVEALLAALAASPVRVTVAGEAGGQEVVVGPWDLQRHVALAVSTLEGFAALPQQLAAATRGDWTAIAKTAVEERHVGLNAMTLAVDCASGASAERRRLIARQKAAPENLLGDAIMAPYYPEVCSAIGGPDLGDAFRGPLASDVPVLFVSGDLDVRTPPQNVQEIAGGFARHTHLLVENASHGFRELMSPEYRRLLQSFLRGDVVASGRIVLPRPRFEEPETRGVSPEPGREAR